MGFVTNYTKDFLTEVAKGNIIGHSIMMGLGEFSSGNIDANGEDICHWELVGGPPRLPAPVAAGEQMTFISSNDADNGATATGVLTIRIDYLDDTGAEQTEDITLDGTTAVHSVATNIRFVNDMYTLTVGSNGVAVGHITCYKFGGSIANDLYNFIALGGNKSLVPHRMVPLGKTLILKAWHCEEAQGKRCAFRIRASAIHGVLTAGVFLFQDVAYLNLGASGHMALNAPLPEFTVVKVSGWSDQALTEGSCGWWGILVANSDINIYD